VPDRNLAKAKELLNAAGWTGSGTLSKGGQPLKIDLVMSEDAVPGSRALSEILQKQFGQAGIELTLRNVDHAVRHGEIPQMKYDLALFITNGAPYDPFNTLVQMFLSTLPPGTDGKIYTDTSFDPLILAAMGAAEKDRPTAFQAAYDWLHDNWAMAPIYHKTRIWAHGDRVKQFVIPATEYEMPLEGLRL
jgi:nickel transport system substrate-binding protein